MPAGEILASADVATRVGTATATADSAGFTTEVSLLTVIAFLEAGTKYSISWFGRVGYLSGTFTNPEQVQLRIREDTVAGTQLQLGQYPVVTSSGVGHAMPLYAEYTAVATGNKTFVFTGQRNGGVATWAMRATANSPGYLYVDALVD